jgi:methyltransferase (TIGR00027 family)
LTWEQDYAERLNPQLLTQLLQDAVPVAAWTGWRLVEVREGFAASELPLSTRTTNQHGTHQATLLALAADYTGGTALGSIIRGVPVIGVHPQRDDHGMALWLVSMEVKYTEPSAAPLRVEAEVPRSDWQKIRSRYESGQTVLVQLPMTFRSDDGRIVAEGRFNYFLKRGSQLGPTAVGAKVNALFSHKSRASARMIAGVRAAEAKSPSPLVRDAWADTLAGPHGRLLAQRFMETLPQLQRMVAARTVDVDRLTLELLPEGLAQVVLVGAGYDMRPFRLLERETHVRTFELDLPHMVEDRAALLARLDDLPAIRRTQVPFDLRLQTVAEALTADHGFDPTATTLFVVEGVSMYLNPDRFERLVTGIRDLLVGPKSRLWIDIVSQAVIDGRTGFDSAVTFVESMQRLGEPFLFGLDDPAGYFTERGLAVRRHVRSSDYHASDSDPVFNHYGFWHLGSTEIVR